MSHRDKTDLSSFQPNVEDDNFVFCLLNELVKAFLRAEECNKQVCYSTARIRQGSSIIVTLYWKTITLF